MAAPARNRVHLVGREAELAKLQSFLFEDDSTVRELVLSGGPGFGKTSLWAAGVEAAQNRGTVALVARPGQQENQLSFAVLSDLLESVDEAVFAALPAPQRQALGVVLLRTEPVSRPPEVRAIAAAFLGVLRELASHHPLLVAIDDVQWLDIASARALSFTQRRLQDSRVAFLMTERTNAGAPRLEMEESERLPLDGLSIEAIGVLLSERLGFHPPPALLQRIFQAAGGNPLFTLELARMIQEGGERTGIGQTLPVPNEIGTLLRQKLVRLPETAKAAALGAALAVDPSTELLEALLGDNAATSLQQLIDADIIDIQAESIRFVHPLMASTVTSVALPRQRRVMHQSLSRIVDDPVASACHLALGSREPDAVVARTLEDAASLARARGRWGTAAELLERSRDLTLPEDVADARRRALAAAEYHSHAGDLVRARSVLEDLLGQRGLTRSDKANGLRLLGDISRDSENFAGAISVYEQALEFVDEPVIEGAIELGLTYVCASSWRLADAAAHGYRALELVEDSDQNALKAAVVAACAMVDWESGRGIAWDKVERALTLEDDDSVMAVPEWPSTVAALLDLFAGNHAVARKRLADIQKRAADQGEQGGVAFLLTWLSWLETRSGNIETAASHADHAVQLAAAAGSRSAHAHALAQRALVHAHQGNVERARAVSAEAAAAGEHVEFLLPRLWASATLALLELSLENPERTLTECAEFLAPVELHGVREPVLVFFLPDAIEALIALGRLDRAELLAYSLEHRGRELDRAWGIATGARCRGLLLAARGDRLGSERAFSDAMGEHERLDMPFERARTLFSRGTCERRGKQRSKARASLLEALAEFERLGTSLWAERARQELARVSGRRPRAEGELTPTEIRVAEFAVQGLSNKAVADALFISVYTVETHLSHIYHKLGVRSRSQLASVFDSPR